MQFAIVCLDKPDHEHLHAENRPAHIDSPNANLEHVLLAGPFLSEDGERPVGSLLIVEFDDLDQTRAFAAGDPYAQAGLRNKILILRMFSALQLGCLYHLLGLSTSRVEKTEPAPRQ